MILCKLNWKFGKRAMEEASEYSMEVPVSWVSWVPRGSDPESRRKEGAPVVFTAGVGGQVTKDVVPSW